MDNPVKKHTLARNTTYLTAGFILQKILSFGYFIYYANIIGFTDTGKYVFAISFVTVFGIVVDLGLSPVLIREIARNRNNAQRYLSNVLGVKSIFAIITALIIIILVRLLGYPTITQQLVWMATAVMIIESLSLTIYGVFRGYQNLKYEAIGSVFFQILTFTAGFVGLQITHNPLVLGVAIVFGSLGNLIYALVNLRSKLKLRFAYGWHDHTLRFLARIAVPFLIAGIFTKIYAYVDIVMLSFFKGDDYVGWYSIAYKLTYSLQFLPIAFSNAIYPVFSRYFIEAKEKLSYSFEIALYYVTLISIPISVGIAVLAGDIVNTLWPTFNNSIPALQIGILGLFFVFSNFIISSMLNACNRQKINTINIGLTMSVNIILNLILIPRLGHVGAALSAVVSALFLFIIGLYWAHRITPFRFQILLSKIVRTLLAALLMGMIVFFLKANIILLVLIGVFSYLIILFMLKGISLNDFKGLWHSLFRKQTAD